MINNKNLSLRKTSKNLRRKKGQSFIEFILAMFAFLTVTFMFVQVAISFGIQNYIQYATFMASRAYLSAYNVGSQQKKAAETYMRAFLEPNGQVAFKGFATPVENGNSEVPGVFIGGQKLAPIGSDNARTQNWMQGVTYTFKSRLYMIPILKSKTAAQGNSVELESQSWLGREPTEEDCRAYLGQRQNKHDIKGELLVDNGC